MKRKIHVVHVIYRFDTGGLENGIVNIINGLSDDLYTHSIVTLTGHSDKFAARLKKTVHIYSLEKKPGKDLFVFLRAFRLFKAIKPDVVHTRNFATIEFQLPAFLARVRYRIHGEHGWDIFDPQGEVKKYQLARRALSLIIDRFVPLSRELEIYLTERVGIAPRNITRICNGVDLKRFGELSRVDADIKSNTFSWADSGIFVIGSVGRLEKIKDHRNLVLAFSLLGGQDHSVLEHCRLVIAGEGSQRAELERLIHEKGLDDKVFLIGDQADIPAVMRHFNLFVLPSKAEGISNTILEAMACGLPVVATQVGGNADLLEDGKTGKLVPSENPVLLSNVMRQYLKDKALAENHGKAGKQRVAKEFSLDVMLKNYDGLYQRANSRIQG